MVLKNPVAVPWYAGPSLSLLSTVYCLDDRTCLWWTGPPDNDVLLHWLSVVNCLLDQSYIGDTCILEGGYSTIDRVAIIVVVVVAVQ